MTIEEQVFGYLDATSPTGKPKLSLQQYMGLPGFKHFCDAFEMAITEERTACWKACIAVRNRWMEHDQYFQAGAQRCVDAIRGRSE